MRGLVKRHPVASFYVLAYLFSWTIAAPLVLQAQGFIQPRFPYWWHYLTLFGPALAALTISGRWRVGSTAPIWLVLAAASPVAFFAVGQFAAVVAGYPYAQWHDLERVNFLPALGLGSWVFWLLTSAGEELGWRGYALPQLQKTNSALRSSILLGCAWAGWHLPAFFYLPSYSAMGVAILPGFLLGILSGSIVLAWTFQHSGIRSLEFT